MVLLFACEKARDRAPRDCTRKHHAVKVAAGLTGTGANPTFVVETWSCRNLNRSGTAFPHGARERKQPSTRGRRVETRSVPDASARSVPGRRRLFPSPSPRRAGLDRAASNWRCGSPPAVSFEKDSEVQAQRLRIAPAV